MGHRRVHPHGFGAKLHLAPVFSALFPLSGWSGSFLSQGVHASGEFVRRDSRSLREGAQEARGKRCMQRGFSAEHVGGSWWITSSQRHPSITRRSSSFRRERKPPWPFTQGRVCFWGTPPKNGFGFLVGSRSTPPKQVTNYQASKRFCNGLLHDMFMCLFCGSCLRTWLRLCCWCPPSARVPSKSGGHEVGREPGNSSSRRYGWVGNG